VKLEMIDDEALQDRDLHLASIILSIRLRIYVGIIVKLTSPPAEPMLPKTGPLP